MSKRDEFYVKENNILQLPLFIFSKNSDKKSVVTKWIDEKCNECKLECNCKYGIPGSFEHDVYTASMRIWVKQGMPRKGVELTYSEIAKELFLSPESWVTHIKKSLKKLGMARYEFEHCFIKYGIEERTTVQFSLYSSTSLYEKNGSTLNGKSKLIFPDEIRENLEAKYYQFLNMKFYRALPSGLPRRLYEYLAKRKRHQVKGTFKISEDVICRWLPINIKNTTRRRETLYKIANELIKIEFLKSYKFNKRNKLCHFVYAKATDLPTPEIQPKFTEVQEDSEFSKFAQWLNSIESFNKTRLKEILSLDQQTTLSIYPAIKKKYEESPKELGPSWLYKALKERWTFKEKEILETKEEKDCRKCKEAYERMSVNQKKSFMRDLRVSVGEVLSGEQLEDFLASNKIWGTWGQMLMQKYQNAE